MTLREVVSRRTEDWPRQGIAGLETEWLPVGMIAVPTGTLAAVDATMPFVDGAIVARVPPGQYVVQGKAMEFEGAIRVSRFRAFLKGSEPRLGGSLGTVDTDFALLALCDIKTVEDIDESLPPECEEGVGARLMDRETEGGETVNLEFGEMSVLLAVCESGLGDGSHPAYALRDDRGVVGLEVEFLPAGFVMS